MSYDCVRQMGAEEDLTRAVECDTMQVEYMKKGEKGTLYT